MNAKSLNYCPLNSAIRAQFPTRFILVNSTKLAQFLFHVCYAHKRENRQM